jgi:hypothetical protein
MLVLKHLPQWSFDECVRKVRGSLVEPALGGIGGACAQAVKTRIRLGQLIDHELPRGWAAWAAGACGSPAQVVQGGSEYCGGHSKFPAESGRDSAERRRGDPQGKGREADRVAHLGGIRQVVLPRGPTADRPRWVRRAFGGAPAAKAASASQE